jgi:hypothetical protein
VQERQQIQEVRRQQKSKEQAEKRAAVEIRIEGNLQSARYLKMLQKVVCSLVAHVLSAVSTYPYRDIQDQLRTDFQQRQEALAQKQAEMQQVFDEENRLKRKMAALMERKRQMALQDAKLTEERKVNEIISKRMRNDEVLAKVLTDRKRAHGLKMESHKLSSSIRWDDVERRKRITGLEQQESIVKMKKDAAKVEKMCQAQADIREQQKDVSIKMSLQRQEINDIMHQCKVDKNWKKAEKKVSRVMSKNAPPGQQGAKKMKALKAAKKVQGGSQSLSSPESTTKNALVGAANQVLAQPQTLRPATAFSLKTATADKIAAALSQSNPFVTAQPMAALPIKQALKKSRGGGRARPKTMESSRHAVYRQSLSSSGKF